MPSSPIAHVSRKTAAPTYPVSCPLDRQAAGPAPASPEAFAVRAGPLDAVVLPEIGTPSAIAYDEFRAPLRPPRAEGAGVRQIVDEDITGRR
jgi:hypothetical protein